MFLVDALDTADEIKTLCLHVRVHDDPLKKLGRLPSQKSGVESEDEGMFMGKTQGSDEAEDCMARNAEGAGQTLTLRAPLRTASSSTSASSVAILTSQ